MSAFDTNVWVRYVTNDDPLQAKRALALLSRENEVFLAKTVLLELEWVLRAVYELPHRNILRALLQILGLPNVRAELPEQVATALGHYENGLDFADALHLASSGSGGTFYTFDAQFSKRARALGLPVEGVA